MQGVLYDITEYKHLEEQLRHSQKMEAVGQLAGGVAHDFNNLLMIIRAHGERILNRLAPDKDTYKDAAEIKNAVDRATGLTRQLLAFSRKQVLQPRVLDINGIVKDVGRMLQRLLGENIHVDVIAASALPHIKFDQGQIEQVILNLALNARDAMPHGGQLTIETQAMQITESAEPAPVAPGRYVLLKVTDTGTGMEEETQRHIFEPFFSTKELGKGTGLGLASVYGVVKQSGGSVSFTSRLGHGTTFVVYLPETEKLELPDEQQPATLLRPKASETILVVEDEHEIRDMVTEYLQQHGYAVLHAQNGREALNIAQRYKGLIHLLITDVVMPELGGRELANEIRELRPRTKVLFTSGYLDGNIESTSVEQGAALLQKPFALSVLASKVREVLDQSVV
ncbi:MAG: response regulator [Acidobacteriaceae bacterium]|nr:response regulator [Acidobacteriaceae bacterium]